MAYVDTETAMQITSMVWQGIVKPENIILVDERDMRFYE